MKTGHKKILPVLMLFFSGILHAQSSWSFVGPYSDNLQNGNGFETSRMNKIVIDPNDPTHLFAGGEFAGLWESTNRGLSWTPVDNTPSGSNGTLAFAFLSTTQLLVGNYFVGYNPGTGAHSYSDKVSIYDFVNHTWQALTALPALSSPYIIKDVQVYPGNSSLIFVCTSMGLIRSSDGGTTWSFVLTNKYPENMVFVPKPGGTGYYCFIAGSDASAQNWGEPVGTSMLMVSSDDGLTFSDLGSYLTLGSGESEAHAMVCVGGTVGNNVTLYTLSTQTPGTPFAWDPYGWDFYGPHFYIDQVVWDISLAQVSSSHSYNSSGTGFGGMGGLRMALAYDPFNWRVWFAGAGLMYLDLGTGQASGSGGTHSDFHDFKIQYYNSTYEMWVANDGGIFKTCLGPGCPNGVPSFDRMNNKLNVCLVNGFSGSQQNPNIYVLGQGDIVNTDIYDAGTKKDSKTWQTWENDGALVDKFNDQNIFWDDNSYGGSGSYGTSSDGGQTLYDGKGFYEPAAGNVFAQGSYESDQSTVGFTNRLFYQDPYHPGRVFFGKRKDGICQYDLVSQTFVRKIYPPGLQPYINNPNGDWGLGWGGIVKGLSFSPQTINSLHFVVDGYDFGGGNTSMPSVIKYIGNNIDDVWIGHNDSYNSSNPQWVNITPNWANFSTISNCSTCNNIAGTDMYAIDFKDIETSPWNKNVVYVLVYIPNNPGIMVLKYDGTNWSNYSQGLPTSESPFSMIMDHASNDGLYLSTDKGVYYRDANAGTNSWVPYTSGLPITFSKQMEVNYNENTVRAGVFGRGIWKSPLSCPTTPDPYQLNTTITAGYYESGDIVASGNITSQTKPTALRGTKSVTLNPGFIATGSSTDNTYILAYIHNCAPIAGNVPGTSSFQYWREGNTEPIKGMEDENVIVYPNPNNGQFTVKIFHDEEEDGDEANASIVIYDLMGREIIRKEGIKEYSFNIDISNQPKGIYLVKCKTGDKITSIKVSNQ